MRSLTYLLYKRKRQTTRKDGTQSHGFKALVKGAMIARLLILKKIAGGDLKMKLSTKIILPIIIISALLILLNGCISTVPDDSPGYTPGAITGIIASPCCSTSNETADGETASPEYWCYFCRESWNLQKGIEVVLTYGEDEVATTTTNDKGEFTFTNVDPGKNYVITAYCPEFDDNRPLVKDVALELIEGGSFDTKTTDLVSTSLGLVVDFLVTYTELTPEDIVLDDVIAANPNFIGFPKFKILVITVRNVLESCGNVDTDEDVQDALCLAAEEVGRIVLPDLDLGCAPGYTPQTPNPPPPPPPPNPCAGNVAPSISSVLLDSTAVIINQTVHVVVGTPYVVTVNASDDGIADALTYSATIEGTPVGTVASNVITVTPLVVGTFKVFVNVNDGCTTTPWGPVTVIVDPVAYTLTINYEYVGGATAAASYVDAAMNVGDPYDEDSPVIAGYTADRLTVSGNMPAADVTETVTYICNPCSGWSASGVSVVKWYAGSNGNSDPRLDIDGIITGPACAGITEINIEVELYNNGGTLKESFTNTLISATSTFTVALDVPSAYYNSITDYKLWITVDGCSEMMILEGPVGSVLNN